MNRTHEHSATEIFGQREQALGKLIGVAIATRPAAVKQLLRRLRIGIAEDPNVGQMADGMMKALATDHPDFRADLTRLLEKVEAENGSEIQEDENAAAIAGAVGMVSQGIGSIFSSKNNRKAAEATAKSNEEQAVLGFRATMIQAANNVKMQSLNSQMLRIKGNQTLQLVLVIGGLILVGGLGYFGYRKHQQQKMQRLNAQMLPV